MKVFVNEPLFEDEDTKRVADCVKTGWVSSEGGYVQEFEQSCSKQADMPYGVALSSGTAALMVAFKALNFKEGDEVIMPSFTIISCVTAILEAGGVPVLVDSDPETYTMNVQQIEQKITGKTKAILAVHIYGHCVDMDPVLECAKKHNLIVIEDVAEGHGGEYKGRPLGSLSDMSVFSFYANKLVTTGEGGMLLTRHKRLALKARRLRNLAFNENRRFQHEEIGYNFRMTNMQAALGIGQINRLEHLVEKKRKMAHYYGHHLAGLPLVLPIEKSWAKHMYWMYAVLVSEDSPYSSDTLTQQLFNKGIHTRPFFLGMHQQPIFNDMGLFKNERYPVCEHISQKGFYLPSGLKLTEDQMKYVCTTLKELLS